MVQVRLIATSLFALAAASVNAAGFTLTSADMKAGAMMSTKQVFKGFGCTGDNISPALAWSGAPAGTKSFALLVHDPDAPTGGAGWWHWVAYNIPADAKGIDGGAGTADGAKMPKGAAQTKTDFGAPGYGGACPPEGHGKHHYHFTLHALKVDKLDIPADATASLAGFMINANSMGKAKLTSIYERKAAKK
jgi:Raf kinase inhibitor-like YbhB/YbcL family protein